jgi:GTPase SAR1 family protein
LCAAVAEAARHAVPALNGPARSEVEAVGLRLAGEFRVAVAGRTNAGKSTIVNALIGERVAPTDRLSCTKLVTWYREDNPPYGQYVLRDGSRQEVALLPGNGLPSRPDLELEQIDHICVWLPSKTLREQALIDTPGYDDHDETVGVRTRDLFGSAAVDAMLFVFNQIPKQDELDSLVEFIGHGSAGGSPLNTIAVLTKADQLDDSDPWAAARSLAQRNSERLANVASTVVPVLGLLAQASATRQLTGNDAWYLRALAGADESALWSAHSLLTADVDIPMPARERLLELLGIYGVRYAVGLLAREEVAATASALTAALGAHSGLTGMEELLRTQFADRADLLQAHRAISTLRRITFRHAESNDRRPLLALRDEVYKLMRHPRMHQLREMNAYELCLRGSVELPENLLADLRALATGRTVAERLGVPGAADSGELQKVLVEIGGRWNSFVNGFTTTSQKEVAMTVQNACAIAWSALDDQDGGQP